MVLVSLLALIAIFGQDSAVARFFYEDDDFEERRQVVSQSLLIQFFSCLLVVPILWLGAGWIAPFLVQHEQRDLFYKIVLAQLPFLVVINFSVNLLKFSFARISFIVMTVGLTALQALALVVGIKVFKFGIREVLLTGLFVSAVFSLLGLYFVRQWLVWPKKLTKFRQLLLFAIPFGVICVASAFSPAMERSMTASYLGGNQLGLYAVGTKIAMLMGLAITAFQTAWAPFSMSLFKQSDAAETYNWVLRLFALAVCALSFVLSISGHFLIQFLATNRYADAAIIVFPLAFGLAIQGTSWITEIGIGISKKSHLGLYGYVCMVGVTMVLIWLLTPVLGLLGVALAVLGGHICKALIASWLAQRAFPLPWFYRPVLTLFVYSLFAGMLGSIVAQFYPGHWATWIYAVSLALLLSLGTAVLFSAAERATIRQLLIARFRRPAQVA